jgi:hypothetical protein
VGSEGSLGAAKQAEFPAYEGPFPAAEVLQRLLKLPTRVSHSETHDGPPASPAMSRNALLSLAFSPASGERRCAVPLVRHCDEVRRMGLREEGTSDGMERGAD